MNDHRSTPFVPAPTGIRFVTALMVLIGHAAAIMPPGVPGATAAFWIEQITTIGMALFFVLSGFVICLTCAASFRDRPFRTALGGFLAARIARLYPVYACAIILAIAMGGVEMPFDRLPWSALTVLMVQAWVPGGDGRLAIFSLGWAGHLWSVSAEMFSICCFR